MPWSWVVPALVLLIAIHYIAVAAGAWYAFTDWSGSHAGAKFVGLSNFRAILHDPIARTALFNTLKLAAAFVVIVNVLGLLLALALNRAVKTRNFVRALFFAPVVLSPLATSYLWSFIFDFNGPLNAFLKAVGLGSSRAAWLGIADLGVVDDPRRSRLAVHRLGHGLLSRRPSEHSRRALGSQRRRRRFDHVSVAACHLASAGAGDHDLRDVHVDPWSPRFRPSHGADGGGPVNASETLATQVYKQTWEYSRFGYGAALALVLSLLIAVVAAGQLIVLRARERRI